MTRQPTSPAARRPVLFPVFLWYSMAACTFFVPALAILAPFLSREFGLSAVHIGLITTSFFVVGAAVSPLFGGIVDAVGAPLMLFALFSVSSAAMIVLAAAQNFAWIIVAAMIGGAGAALGNPATNSLISDEVTEGRRGVVVGFKQAGVPAASILAGVLLPPVALLWGWRPAVGVGAVLAGIGLVGAVRLRRGMPRVRPGKTADEAARSDFGIYRSTIVRLALYVLLTGAASATVQTYLVLFGVDHAGLSETAAGIAVGLMGLLGLTSRIAAPHLAERLDRPLLFLRVAAGGSLISVVIIMAAEHNAPLLFVGAAGMGLTGIAANSLAHLVVVSHLPRRMSGRASGAVQLGFYLGWVATPAAFGWLVDVQGSYTTGWLLAAVLCGVSLLPTIGWRFSERPAVRR